MAPRYIEHGIECLSSQSRNFPADEANNELVSSLEKIIKEYSAQSSYHPHEFQGLYSGPTSIAYLFLQLDRSHRDLSIRGQRPIAWAAEYLKIGDRVLRNVDAAKCGVASETLAWLAVQG